MSTFEDRLVPLLTLLCHSLLDERCFGHVQSLANLLEALNSGCWRTLPNNEQVFWLNRLSKLLVGRDSISEVLLGDKDGALHEAAQVVAAQKKALERLL